MSDSSTRRTLRYGVHTDRNDESQIYPDSTQVGLKHRSDAEPGRPYLGSEVADTGLRERRHHASKHAWERNRRRPK